MKIKPILNPNNYKSKDGYYPIYVRVNLGQKRTLLPVGAKIKKDSWDQKKGRVKIDKEVNAVAINMKIIEMCNSIEKNHLQGGGVESGNKEDFYWWFEERIKFSETKHSGYNKNKLQSVYNKLKNYSPTLNVRQLDYKFLMDYEKHLLELGNATNTVADNLMRIRVIMIFIIRSIPNAGINNPFLTYKLTTEKTNRKRISIESIELLQNANIKNHPSVELARDMYVLSFYCAGIRFGDLCRLKMGMIEDGRLKFRMHKTKIDRNIKLMPQALEVIKKYSKSKGYIFNTKVNWSDEEKSINIRNSFYNKKLKWLCRQLEIEEVTFHTSRNSFADYAKKKGIDIHTLKDLLGHSKVASTEKYMKAFYEEETDQALSNLFG